MYKKGDKFLVKKGTEIHGTFPGKKKVAKKDYYVTLTYFYSGWEDRKPEVEWVGAGGYWHRIYV
jgi:hypothetical protein